MSRECRRSSRGGSLVLSCAISALASAAAAAPPFEDATQASGLGFVHFNGMTGEGYFPEIMGSGGGLLDYDGDGDLDLFLSQGRLFRSGADLSDALLPPAHPLPLSDRLYRNDGPLTGGQGVRFADVTTASGLAGATGFGMGATAGDFDGDGDTDLYVLNHGPNQLWRNDGDGTFTDVTATAGVGDPGWTTAAVFFDFDRDGDLDLASVNYVEYTLATHKVCQTKSAIPTYCSPALFKPSPDRLYENQGDGTFRDATQRLGLDRAYGPGLGAVAADFDGDGWLDLYVANDGEPNQLWMNRAGRGFSDEALMAGAAVSREGKPQASMGVDAEDFDGDGDVDLFMTHLDRETNTLYVNDGSGLFTDRTIEAGLAVPSKRYTGFGTAFLDYDNDSDLDLLVVNGEVDAIDELYRAGDVFPYDQRNQLFENVGGRFREVTDQAGAAFEPVETSRGALVGDLDDDGDLDVVITNNSGPTRVLINRVGAARGWVGLRVVGPQGGDALGARVELLRSGAPSLWQRVATDGSYASAGDPRVLFGLGAEPPETVTVRVHWLGGPREEWTVPTRRYTTLRRGTGQAPGQPAGQD